MHRVAQRNSKTGELQIREGRFYYCNEGTEIDLELSAGEIKDWDPKASLKNDVVEILAQATSALQNFCLSPEELARGESALVFLIQVPTVRRFEMATFSASELAREVDSALRELEEQEKRAA